MKKIIFCDIDKTLTSGFVVSKENIDKVKEYVNLGGIFVLISGRGVKYLKEFAKQFNNTIRYVIANNGAVIYDLKNNSIIHKTGISKKSYDKLVVLCRKYNSNFIINTTNEILVNNFYKKSEINTIVDDLSYNRNDVIQLVLSNEHKEDTIKLIVEVEKIEDIKIVNRHRSLYDSNYEAGNNIWIDIVNKHVNKGLGVKKMLGFLNINLNDSVRIGDDLNDYQMFYDKGINIAVENGIEKLKNKADIIVPKCDLNGVSIAISKIINEEV